MLKRILIANRGEIAVRIIRACRELSVETIAVYTESDREELHTMLADRAVCIGRDRPESGYLNMENIIEAAKLTGCDAIHPGFGFLSENPRFAEMCEENDIVFIGPNSSVISLLGDKIRARQIVSQAGVSIVPGSDGPLPGIEEAKQCARKIGYPVMIKASAGGGGRGMRRAESEEELENAMMEAKTEAEVSFGDGTIYMEKLITDPKHIEFQILADSFGNIIHLGDRNCCVQRRNQKMLEEAPDFRLSDEMRTKMGRDAVLAAKTAGYENAGTVEFIVDGSDYYFIEMNTRLQVEHPVTEMITGTDIVKQQIRIASGLRLNMAQQDIINFLHLPSGLGVRVESALYSGMRISPFYDSMILKVITYGDTRLEAVRRMRRALGETIIRGCKTNLPVLQLILYNREFLRGDYNTGFMEKHGDHLLELYDAAGGRLNESV